MKNKSSGNLFLMKRRNHYGRSKFQRMYIRPLVFHLSRPHTAERGVLSRTKVPEHHFCAVKLLGWQQQRGERREVL